MTILYALLVLLVTMLFTTIISMTVLYSFSLKTDIFYVQSGEMEDGLKHFQERNKYLDTILAEVLHYGGSRRIIFSCFDPDICTM